MICIPRLAHIAGHQLASELLLTGKTVSAAEARDRFGFVNQVVPSTEQLLPAAIKLAQEIVANSPDAVQSTKYGLLLTQKHNVTDTVAAHVRSAVSKRTYGGDNIKTRAYCEPITWEMGKVCVRVGEEHGRALCRRVNVVSRAFFGKA
ncbi:hypothetical protein D9613_004394 [Agrocybe pediades]|uniref:Enoyl-CoA hydratase n=1 Tax=Agrocybe pediades TaxID=84607 RepID=A0A8H4VKQ7_9AGAR|nr:hypothetical protein D9613_004394 [Agrocybe pediades]